MSRRVYTPTDKARVFAELSSNDGNIRRTARTLDIPVSTVRDWKTEWQQGGPSPEVAEVLPAVIEDLVGNFQRVRDKGLLELERQIEHGTLKGQPLVAAVGMLTDKIRLYRGEATSRSESTALPAPAQLRELVTSFFAGAVTAAQLRAEEIDDAHQEPPYDLELPVAEEEKP